MTPKFSLHSTCRKCEKNLVEAVEQKEALCDDLEAVREFVYLRDAVSDVENVSLL